MPKNVFLSIELVILLVRLETRPAKRMTEVMEYDFNLIFQLGKKELFLIYF